ncbi:MAG TPA: ACP phosphodiesterase [Saprospiraceae bacterium]|nr:ACP phosphodiesterase [Saprospiraceae bacterium]
MNHLAHLLLSGDQKDWMVGNFITDFLKPSEQRSLPPSVREGIRLHLFIDRTVDEDPDYRESIRMIRATQGKYAPVVADIYYDYLLHLHWDRYSDHSFPVFRQDAYRTLIRHLPENVNENLAGRVRQMIERDFLESYSSPEHMPGTFSMLKRRVHFENALDRAAGDFERLLPQLIRHFNLVFPRIQAASEQYRLSLQS